ncbi:flavin-containing monooxygenase [Spongisporangium articulatum]|uniref:Flavin-containing monooxygenase 5 n=1 Tax=Spongisporangium articulatum TaxID=3362603 RepID=A0ABW8ALH2_9ACTN
MTRKVAVIGAGASGLSVAKVLHERGLDFDVFELSDRVGGMWVFRNPNGRSGAYRSLRINTSRARMEFSDFPLADDLPDFIGHEQVADYFEKYVTHFGFRSRIRFRTAVEHVQPLDDREGGGFRVRLSTGETSVYSDVVVANGHHWDVRMPEPAFPGADTTSVQQLHAHDYEDESQLAGKRVVVLGMGNSAMDIAVDASYHAAATYLSARSGVHVIPKYLFGKPYDSIGGSEWLPSALRWPFARLLMRTYTGPMTRYGLPKPDHKFAQAHPSMSSRILDRLAHGDITPKPTIQRLDEDAVVFADGSRVEADLVIYCTGYRISFPFFDPDFLDVREDNRIRLYRRLFHPDVPGLYFVGLVQPLGAVMPITERQAQLVADHLQGRYGLPSKRAMNAEIDRHARRQARRYVASKRHTIQVDFDDYMRQLRLERLRGRRRRKAGAP